MRLAAPFVLMSAALSAVAAEEAPKTVKSSPASAVASVQAVPGSFANASQPMFASAPSGSVYMAFGTHDGGVWVAELAPGGSAFGEPRLVAREPDLALGMRRGPRVVATAQGLAVSFVAARFDRAARKLHGSQDLVCYRSADAGKTWEGPVRVNVKPATCGEGLHAMTVSPSGEIVAAWLSAQDAKEGSKDEEGQDLLFSRSTDLGKTWSAPSAVYASPSGSVCTCCHPSLAAGKDGKIAAMWRNDLEGCRDLYWAPFDPKSGTFGKASKLGQGSWKLQVCPMDGGAIALGPDGGVVTAWRRDKQVFAAGAEGAETELGVGKDPWVACGPSGAVAVWVQQDAIHWKRLGDKAAASARLSDPAPGIKQGSPCIVAIPGGGFLAAWDEYDPKTRTVTIKAARIP